ncbi:MAG: PhoH family protein [Candidatus Wolfebacteria bacterium GW2011_GWC2_39_22]|uniref:PhoH family protein n=1 Tax=Candidatus Wolfebacteria bacterium GW2011_GWC2_39_22 TaxID=1619013 RepID=A0A0G0QRC7_9BACT|nr:MAG: PhoH family protein [Candidatus Wolfebacteria bacterium GW2011_GWC2_39_22]HBI25405.1 phosphate starvation-inducible protein PhoH [Candidatus Wolfebacteria bacterium]
MPPSKKKEGGKKKVFILDTCVLVHDTGCIEKFGDNIVVIPIWAVEELDGLKKRQDEVGANARIMSRKLDAYKKQGPLAKGVPTEGGGLIIVDYNGNDFSLLPVGLERNRDNRILLIGQAWTTSQPKRPQQKRIGSQKRDPLPEVTFSEAWIISKDANLRLKADACGILSEDYLHDKLVKNVGEMYTGIRSFTLSDAMGDLLNGASPVWTNYRIPAGVLASEIDLDSLLHNQCCELTVCGKKLLAIYKKDAAYFRVIDKQCIKDGGVKPINDEQWFAYYLAIDPEIAFTSLGGHAGTGKTLVALTAGLKLLDEGVYDQVLVYRPNCPLGEDLGFLPGDISEKFAPWMLPIIDNMRLILGKELDTGKPGEFKGKANPVTEMIKLGILEISPIVYLRGRSIHKCYVIVDEAQNLTPHEAKTIISRAGEGTKIIFTGDVEQIDNPRVDSISNGFVYAAESLKDLDCIGHVTLLKSERSRLAELVATRM